MNCKGANVIDRILGIECKRFDWSTLVVKIPRPEGFIVEEEVDYLPITKLTVKETGKYNVYILTKKSIDHFTALNKIQKISSQKIRYLGIKDAGAITTQIIYTEGEIDTAKVSSLDGLELRKFGRTDEKFNHTGNRFTIFLQFEGNKEEMIRRINSLKKSPAIPSYIGYQRFGTRRPITHVVGKYISMRKWREAFFTIVGNPFEAETEPVKNFRRLVQNGEFEEALKECPKYLNQEKKILQEYVRSNSFIHALKASLIPLSFYVEAYQSYLYNRILSRYLERSKDLFNNSLPHIIKVPTYFGDCDDICRQVYIDEGIERNSFTVDEFKIKVRTFERKPLQEIRNITYEEKPGGVILSFSLDRGQYASMVIRELSYADPRTFT